MRKILLAVVAALTIVSVQAQEKRETLEGNGKVVSRDVPVTSFSSLKASGVYELKLSQGSKESVTIEADENLQDLFQVRNEGNTLVIDMKKLENKNLKGKITMKVHVTFRDLKDLNLSTVGNVKSEEELTFGNLELKNSSVGNVDLVLNADKVDISNSSVGNVKLSGKASDAVVKNSGVGSFQAASFVVQTMNIENSGIGSAEVNAARELKVTDNGMGRVKNRGAAVARKKNKVVI